MALYLFAPHWIEAAFDEISGSYPLFVLAVYSPAIPTESHEHGEQIDLGAPVLEPEQQVQQAQHEARPRVSEKVARLVVASGIGDVLADAGVLVPGRRISSPSRRYALARSRRRAVVSRIKHLDRRVLDPSAHPKAPAATRHRRRRRRVGSEPAPIRHAPPRRSRYASRRI